METTMIKALEEEIKSKKLLLKLMKLEEKQKNKQLFTETKFGKACLKSLATVTSPFHKMHEKASAHLQSPVLAHFGNLVDDAQEILKEASDVLPGDKKAVSLANECARLFMEIESFSAKHNLPAFCEADKYQSQLKEQLERLRPPTDPDRFNVISEQLEAAVPQA